MVSLDSMKTVKLHQHPKCLVFLIKYQMSEGVVMHTIVMQVCEGKIKSEIRRQGM